ncbi:MAG: glutamate synthase-related protein, partial [Halodesulfurarchaeum sp.]
LEDGILKTMSKMGISTFQSYHAAQVFETVGLDTAFVDEYFTGTPARTEGVGIKQIESDLRERHDEGFHDDSDDDPDMDRQGEYDHKSYGVHHQWNPRTVSRLQEAVREDDYETYRSFAVETNDQTTELQTLRGMLEFDGERESIPLDDVEPVEEIVHRFSTAPMSLGSISPEAHETNAIAMNWLGAKSNTGEGGEPPERFGTNRECSVKQVASGRFGVTSAYLSSAEELQIKIAQGSKPGEGGHLPGKKVNEMIADVRYTVPGVDLISPPPQHDIYSIEDLKQLIYDLKAANPDADVNVKLVAEAGIGPIAAGVAQANADTIHISGHSGGTGASPKTSIKNAGVPWELGLTEANRMLHETGLRDRVRLSVDGGLKTGRDVAIATLLGAEEYVFGTASLISSGCVMARICHTNNCPTGVATQKPELRERFDGHPEYSINYFTFIAEELREIMADIGFSTINEMIGRVDVLSQRTDIDHPKARTLDLSYVLEEPDGRDGIVGRKTEDQRHDVDSHFDHELLDDIGPALEDGTPISLETTATNEDRAVGAFLSNAVSERYGEGGFDGDTVDITIRGTPGQSFGAFLTSGITLTLVGSANDYVGKGLSGGRICVRPPATAGYEASQNISVGNVALYGATRGELYVNGRAGERFAVRNSGVHAVVEGVGDHACEYMTGGIVVVLGSTGTNFAAGMSGGIAYVYDPHQTVEQKVNPEMVTVSREGTDLDERVVKRLLERHANYTESGRAATVLDGWETAKGDFVTVIPDPYRDTISEDPEKDARRTFLEKNDESTPTMKSD